MDINRGWGNVFQQLEFDQPFEYLTCSAVDDITVPEGDITLKYEPDPNRSGNFRVTSRIKGEAGAPTMSLVRPLRKVYNYLMETTCPAQYRVNWACRGDRTIKTNYTVGLLLLYGDITNRNMGTPTALEPDDEERVETNADLSGLDATMVYQLTGEIQSNSFAYNINDMAFLMEACENVCGDKRGKGDFGYAVMDAERYLYTGQTEIGKTKDGGSTWEAVTGEPFGKSYTEDILCIILKETSSDHRIIVGREGLPGTRPQTAYSDDEGESWSQVTLTTGPLGGSVNDLEKDVTGALWAALDSGYVFKSEDNGNSWTAKESGVETTEDLNAIAFNMITMFESGDFGVAVGDSNAFLYTTDGGDSWASSTGPAAGVNLLTVDMNRWGHIYVGTNDGRLFRSTDGSDTDADSWVEVEDRGSGSIDYVHFEPYMDYFGAYTWNDTGPEGTVYRTEDGGASWYTTVIGTTPTNQGINVVRCVAPNLVYAGGNTLTGGEPFTAKFSRRS